MRVWRLARAAHAELDGEGARLYGARWTSVGVAAVYAAEHLSLAALEYLVHVDIEDAPDDLMAVEIEVPDDAGELAFADGDLPRAWRDTPAPEACRQVGDRWAGEGEALVLRVPSVLVPEESNVLVNPAHPRASEVRAVGERRFVYDPRLLRGGG
ncbi:MAG TPA: RES family NAD+ phosphorylase [Longimicrobiales bacterium]|nr:RES family NAD+ phosphorylase [Longimicrobiales bacterium]